MHPIDFADKLRGRLIRAFKPIKRRRTISHSDYINEILLEEDCKNEPSLLIAIDDLSSLGFNNGEIDMGGKNNGEILNNFKYLLNMDLKITAFTIPKPCFKKNSEKISSYIDRDYIKLQEQFIYWAKLGMIEIAQHGYKHIRNDNKSFSRSMEFEWQENIKITDDIIKGYKLLKSNDIKINGFKPPAWSIGQLDGKFKALDSILNLNFYDYVALSSPTNGLNYITKSVSHIHPTNLKGKTSLTRNIPQNISILSPINKSKELIKLICEKGGIVSIQSHACMNKNIIADGLSNEHCERIKDLSDYAISLGAKTLLAKDIK